MKRTHQLARLPEKTTALTPAPSTTTSAANWKAWAANLALTSLGLVAVLAGNLLTLLLAWSALDIIGIIDPAWSGVDQCSSVGRSCVPSGARWWHDRAAAGWDCDLGRGRATKFWPDRVASANLLLFTAAGLRLGIFPLQVPFFQELPLRIGLGTTLRLVPAAASLVLMVRTAEAGSAGDCRAGAARLYRPGRIGW